MYTNITPKKANLVSLELLELSRSMRRSRESIEDVQQELRQLTELDECKAALRKQEESLTSLTARLMNLSTALREIAELYQNTEERIQDTLEEQPRSHHEAGKVVIYGATDKVHKQIQQILYK